MRAQGLREKGSHESGFTLIELLVVILIIGVLAAIAVPMFLNQRQAAAEAALRSDMKNMATHVYTYLAQDPQNIHTLSKLTTEGNGWSVIVRAEGALFQGDKFSSVEGDYYPEGMDPFQVSDGVAVGVVSFKSALRNREAGEFCIMGNHEGTKYRARAVSDPGMDGWMYPLYYDASAGGFYEFADLEHSTGACLDYWKRVNP